MDEAPSGRPPPEPWHSLGLRRAFVNSAAGFVFAFRSERAFRQETFVLIAAIPAVFWISPDPFRRALLIGSLMAVLAVELLNTGLEKICDLVHPTPHPIVKAAKDMGSAATLASIGVAMLLWGVTLWESVARG